MNKLSGWVMITLGIIVLVNPLDTLNVIPVLIGLAIAITGGRSFMKSMKNGRFSPNSLLVVFLGAALLLATDTTLTWASMAIAIVIIGLGLSNVIGFRRRRYPHEELRFNGGLAMVVVGLVWFILPDLPFLLLRTIIGLLLVLIGIVQLSIRATVFQRSTWNQTIKEYMNLRPEKDDNIIDVDVDE